MRFVCIKILLEVVDEGPKMRIACFPAAIILDEPFAALLLVPLAPELLYKDVAPTRTMSTAMAAATHGEEKFWETLDDPAVGRRFLPGFGNNAAAWDEFGKGD